MAPGAGRRLLLWLVGVLVVLVLLESLALPETLSSLITAVHIGSVWGTS